MNKNDFDPCRYAHTSTKQREANTELGLRNLVTTADWPQRKGERRQNGKNKTIHDSEQIEQCTAYYFSVCEKLAENKWTI